MTLSFYILSALMAFASYKVITVLINFFKNLKTFRNVPGPPKWPLPFIGHLYDFQRESKEIFYGNLVTRLKDGAISKGHEILHAFIGPLPVIFVVGPNAAEVLLRSSKHMEKGFMYNFLQQWLGTGLLTAKGEKWKVRRKLLTPTFHFSILQEFLDIMNEQSFVFTEKLEKITQNGESIDVFKPVTMCALDIICETAMGVKINAQDDSDSDYVNALKDISEVLFLRVRSPWVWWDYAFSMTKLGKRYFKCLEILHGFTKSVINDRMNDFNGKAKEDNHKKRLAFLDMLLKVSDGGKVLSFEDIQEEVDTFMFEGHDTTAAAMSWAIFLIGTHKDVQKKIQDELSDVLGPDQNRKITMEDLRNLQYLELVIKECLRVLPSVPIIGRKTSSDCIMDGHNIPEGTECFIFPQMINNYEKFWPEADRFDPERFSADKSVGRHPYAYLPFSAGPRNCIGQRFALMEEKVILAHLLRKFSVESCDKREDLLLCGDVILRPGKGINVRLKKR